MFRITTNRTEESWARRDIKNAKPSEDSNEILERINKISTAGMSYDAAVDFFKMQLGTWRRFYKEDDNVEIDEAYTADNRRVTQIKSLNIVFYVREIKENEIKVTSGFYDTIKTSCKKLFEDMEAQIQAQMVGDDSPSPGDSIEMLEKAK